jgi:archaellum component FlaG (FlaF/FlaG flagellin family)
MSQMGLASYAEVALILFFLVFLVLAARTLFLTHSSEHLSAARIPLESDADSHELGGKQS